MRSRSAICSLSARGRNSQKSPWWAISSCPPAATARSISFRWAETPVITISTSADPGTCSPFGP